MFNYLRNTVHSRGSHENERRIHFLSFTLTHGNEISLTPPQTPLVEFYSSFLATFGAIQSDLIPILIQTTLLT
jgi:hypothetical protein